MASQCGQAPRSICNFIIPAIKLPETGALAKCNIESRRSSLVIQSHRAWALFALAIACVALFFRLGSLPLLEPDEGRNAEVAREMKESGAWLSPSYNGIAYLDKPAFYFKAVALSLAVFGDNETAARLPSAVFGLALLALTFAFCRRVHGMRCAILAVIVVATMPLFVVNARTVIFDIALAFFVSAAIFAGYRAEECEGKSRRNWYLLGAFAAGFATLVKGPVGFLIPSLVLFVFNRVEGRHGVWKRFFAPLNLLAFFGVTLPWFVGLSLQHPDFPYYGIIEESFHRFTTTEFHRAKPFYFYAIIVAGMFLPWSFVLPEAGVMAWKRKSSLSSVDRLCIVWAVVVVIFFSLSKSKMPGYILSATVACGILVARFFEHVLANPDGKAARIAGRAVAGIVGLCLVSAIAVTFLSTRMELLARPLGIPVADANQFKQYVSISIGFFLTFVVLGLLARCKRDVGLIFIYLALFPVLLFSVNFGILKLAFNAKSAAKFAQQIPALPPQTELAFLHCYPNGLTFYLNRTATLITRDGRELSSNYILFALKDKSKWPANLVDVAKFEQWMSQRNHPVYLVTSESHRSDLEKIERIKLTDIQPLMGPYIGVLIPAP